MNMTGWDEGTLDVFGSAEEITIGTIHNGALVNVPIWIVRVGPDIYIRSFRGTGARWYTRAIKQRHATISTGNLAINMRLETVGDTFRNEIDAAYRAKYGRYGDSYIGPMTSPGAVETTMRLTPLRDKEPTS